MLYRLAPGGEALFPRREGRLLRQLATFLIEHGHESLLEDFFAVRAERRRAELQRRVAGLAGRARLDEVARILSEEGFLAEVEPAGDGPRLRLCHCPLQDLVQVSRLPCRAEMALVEELLGEPLHRVAFMPDGAHTCTYAPDASATADA